MSKRLAHPPLDLNLERRLQIAIGCLIGLGTVLLGIGQGSTWIPMFAIFVAVTGVYFTDLTGTIRLSHGIATFAAFGTVLVALLDSYRLGPGHQLLAITNLLIYLQAVLMYRPKDVRIYWQLLMLNLLQVIVGSALSSSLVFGLLLMLYLFVGLFTMALFLAYREAIRFRSAAPGGGAARALLPGNAEPDSLAFAPVCRQEQLRSVVGRGLVRQVVGMGAVTLVATSLIFFLVPRLGKGSLLSRTATGQLSVGFNETIELGRLGEAFQDPASVMRVWFTDAVAQRPYVLGGEPLFRGAVVDTYSRGAWGLHGRSSISQRDDSAEPLFDAPRTGELVLERIALEPQGEDTVFSVFPAFRLDSNCPVKYDPPRQRLVRKSQREPVEFTLATTGIVRGRQAEITAAEFQLNPGDRAILTQLPKPDAAGKDPLERLREFADKVVRDSQLPESDRQGRARALERALRDSPRFTYSLVGVPRDPSLDPIEDFVAVNPRGHCEYFASALALMLRSQKIPARLVLGYRGSEFNSLGSYYQVRKLHAHSWVEAYLDPPLPAGDDSSQLPRGGWLSLDPTPGSFDEALRRGPTLAERARDWIDFGDYLWSNYVVGLNAKRQQEMIYSPLHAVTDVVRQVFSRELWTKTVPRVLRTMFSADGWKWLKTNWFSWPAFAAGLLLVLLANGSVRLSRRFFRWRSRRRPGPAHVGPPARTPLGEPVAFYERLEALLLRCGIRRGESQTQHEFAIAVAARFVESPQWAPAAMLPRRVVDAFYRVRFGRHSLDKTEIERVEQALRELQACLALRSARPR